MSGFKKRYFVGDFETTVFEKQESTEVWASACVELYTDDVQVFHSIDELFIYLLGILIISFMGIYVYISII